MVDMKRLYIVRTAFTSPNQRESTEEIDNMTEKVTLRWQPEVRQAIGKVRNTYAHKIKVSGLNFYGLTVIQEKDKEQVCKTAEEADGEMKKISPDMEASVRLIPLYVESEAKGEVYAQVLASIQGRIYTELLGRLKELAKLDQVPTRSRNALLKLVDRLKVWNVLDDPDVSQTLADIRRNIENDIFKPLMVDLQKDLDALKSRGAYLEFDDEPAPTTAAPAEAIKTTEEAK